MSIPEDGAINQDRHKAASDKLLNALQEAANEGLISASESGYVASFVCVVETLDSEGNSGMNVLWGDPRLTVLLGLLDYGHMWIGSHANMRGEEP